MESIANKTAIISGASKGIGRAIALELAKNGVNTILIARSEEELKSLEKEIKIFSAETLSIVCDITNEREILNSIEKGIERFGKIDFLINNAGTGTFKNIDEVSIEEYDQIMDVNVRATFIFLREFSRIMKTQKSGHIITIASDVSTRTFETGSVYCSSKYAQNALNLAVRKELRPHGVKVSVIYPGIVDTYFNNSIPGSDKMSEYLKPEDIANSVLYILSAPKHVVIDELVIHPLKQEY